MIIYISEVIGTFMFVYLLLSIIANAICSSENNKISLLTTSIGVGLAYVVPCILFGEVSGAHFNPIITIATSVFDVFEIRFMWGYIIAEAIGAFLASVLYIVFFKSKFTIICTVFV